MSKGATIPVRTPERIAEESMPHSHPDAKRQMWGCVVCGEKRQYGEGRPDPETLKMLPFIRCNYCAGPTRHFYIGIVQENEPSNRGGFRPGAGRKAKEVSA